MHLAHHKYPLHFPTPINSSVNNDKSLVDDDYIPIPILLPCQENNVSQNDLHSNVNTPRKDATLEVIKESKHRQDNEKYYMLSFKLNELEERTKTKFSNIQENINFLEEEFRDMKKSFNDIKTSLDVLHFNYLQMMNRYQEKSFVPLNETNNIPLKKKSTEKKSQVVSNIKTIPRIGSNNSLKKSFK
jgi:hypothetical protein